MNSLSSQHILHVERAISDLRRGTAVILEEKNTVHILTPTDTKNTSLTPAAISLLKLAGLLPFGILRPLTTEAEAVLLRVSAEEIAAYPRELLYTTHAVSEANIPLQYAKEVRVVAFRSRFDHEEHLAIIIGNPAEQTAPLVRIHSSCMTGDILGSLRCDCGDQLHSALHTIAATGHGIILYLQQEGRGIGIANKLHAYALQDTGLDTVEANEALGFLADERDFSLAVHMLQALGILSITLLTNNPQKVKALAEKGVTVIKRQSLIVEANPHNQKYLHTKATKLGHRLEE